LKSADFAGESGHAGSKPVVGTPTAVLRDHFRGNDDVAGLQLRRKGTSNSKAHQAVRVLDCALDESGRAFPISGTDHDRKARCARDPRLGGQS
jgi:hypothetical protein